MKVYVFDFESHGHSSKAELCFDSKVHITEEHWDSDSDGYGGGHVFGSLRPCDGSCHRTRDLPSEVAQLVEKFLASNGKERGEVTTYGRERRDDEIELAWQAHESGEDINE